MAVNAVKNTNCMTTHHVKCVRFPTATVTPAVIPDTANQAGDITQPMKGRVYVAIPEGKDDVAMMHNCTDFNRAMYEQGHHDAVTQMIAFIVAVLSVMAVAAALVAALSPVAKPEPVAPPAYSAGKNTYEDGDAEVLHVEESAEPSSNEAQPI